jgi:acetoin utilization protein AcuB
MTTDVVTVAEDTPIMKASVIMKEKSIRCLPVLDERRKLVGIVSDRDLKDASPSKATSLDIYELNYLISNIRISSIMTMDLVFVRTDDTVEFASILMLENKISSLPVLNHFDSLVGIITQTDVFKSLINIAGIYTGGIQFALSLENRPGSISQATDVIRSHGGRIVSILSTTETAEEGCHHVYIRTAPLREDKLAPLLEELEARFVVIYAIRDMLEEVESRRIRIPK